MGGWVYIVANRLHGTLYTGVTSDLARRIWEHRNDVAEGFSSRYKLHLLVHAEFHDDIQIAIQREKTIKKWSRAWKLDLVEKENPNWEDRFEWIMR